VGDFSASLNVRAALTVLSLTGLVEEPLSGIENLLNKGSRGTV